MEWRRRRGRDSVVDGGRASKMESGRRLPSGRPLNIFADSADDLLGEGLRGVSTSLSLLSLVSPCGVGDGDCTNRHNCCHGNRAESRWRQHLHHSHHEHQEVGGSNPALTDLTTTGEVEQRFLGFCRARGGGGGGCGFLWGGRQAGAECQRTRGGGVAAEGSAQPFASASLALLSPQERDGGRRKRNDRLAAATAALSSIGEGMGGGRAFSTAVGMSLNHCFSHVSSRDPGRHHRFGSCRDAAASWSNALGGMVRDFVSHSLRRLPHLLMTSSASCATTPISSRLASLSGSLAAVSGSRRAVDDGGEERRGGRTAGGEEAVDPRGEATGRHVFDVAMTLDQVCKRLEGVPVYTVTNASNEFVLISGSDESSSKSLGLFCFSQDDAEALLAQVKDREPALGKGARVVAVSLDKVYQLSAEGIAFRFLPEASQVMNALALKAKAGDSTKDFDGVPVFQSDNLIVRSHSKRYCPLFLCKEDLDTALRKALKAQQQINPVMKNVSTEVQVGSLEDVLRRMEDKEEGSGWGDIILIPPGVDVSTYLSRTIAAKEGQAATSGSPPAGSRATLVA